MLSRREREFLNDLTIFRVAFREAGGVRALRANEEQYVRGRLDDKYGSRYVLVLRNRIRKRVSAALDDLLELTVIDADDPTSGKAGPHSMLPNRLEDRLLEVITANRKRTEFRASRRVETLVRELQITADEFLTIDATNEGQ